MQPGVLVERRVYGRDHLSLISGFFVVFFAGLGRPEVHHFAGHLVDEQQIFIGMGLLFPAVMLVVHHGILWTLATAFRPVNGQGRRTLQGQRADGHPARIALRRHAESGEGPLEDGEQVMHPVVGLRLAQLALPAVHGVQRMRLLVDEDEAQLVFHRQQDACGAATPLTLAPLAFRLAYNKYTLSPIMSIAQVVSQRFRIMNRDHQ